MARPSQDPYPFTWEIPLAAIAACGMVFAVGVQSGRAIACLLAGKGFRWPRSTEFFGSLPGVLTGDPAAGLAEAVTGVPPGLLVATIIATEVVLFAVLGWAGYELVSRWGPTAPKGMATTSEAERLLGRSRLFRSRRMVRPDLYGARALPAKGA
ncbi:MULTISPECIES: hypothetical protein [Propionibacteriales]|uniref:hypothetical protein n=1 Tax=Propionibacteriales TaxID=85009 RepID=UPI002B20199E|nr:MULTISPECIES: hypothetical protein [Propionibacteriales]MEA4945839.1 hypothetical protein [Propionicimonas sp.]MEA5052034.1 hypothetical protein [Propionicimonas sp.]MEA5155662.1 hypothetical protein [Raineyella sp.]